MSYNRHDLRRISRITGISAASLVAAITQASGAPPRELLFPGRPSLILPDSALSREERGMMQKLGIVTGLGFVPAFGGGGASVDPATVFKTTLWNAADIDQTVTTSLNLPASGGLYWFKSRANVGPQYLFDTVRGEDVSLSSNTSASNSAGWNAYVDFLSTGIRFPQGWSTGSGISGSHVLWSFAKAPKFFDIVSFDNGAGSNTNHRISHNLGSVPGMIIIKATNNSYAWDVFHRSFSNPMGDWVILNGTGAVQAPGPGSYRWGTSPPTTTDFGFHDGFDSPGTTYVAYLFAHDPDGIIQCGSFTNDASGNATVNIGWQPQFLLIKNSSTTGNWFMFDTTRQWGASNDYALLPNLTNTEITGSDYGAPTSTGFTIAGLTASATMIYLAIRAP